MEIARQHIATRSYKFDVNKEGMLSAGAKIINMHWDFDYGDRFSSTTGFSFIRSKKKVPPLQTQYEFPRTGKFSIVCKVQNDMGGLELWDGEIVVE